MLLFIRRAAIALALVLSASGIVRGQSYRIAPVPSWVVVNNADGLRLKDTACVAGGMENLLVDRQYDLASRTIYFKRSTRLISAEGVQDGARFEASFDPAFEKLTLHVLRIVRNGVPQERLLPAQIRTFQQEKDMDAYLYDGSLTVVSDLQDVRVGDVVEFAYSITGSNPADGGRFHRYLGMGFDEPVAHCFTRFVVPDGRSPIFRPSGDVGQETSVHTARGTEHTWSTHDVPCERSDDGAPGWFMSAPYLEVSEFKDVEDLRRWAIGLFQADMRPTGAMAALAGGLALVPDTLQRLDSAIRIVQRDVRYLGLEGGIGAYRPHPPVQVFEQRFGDCKDKSLLLVALLRASGIHADPALVSTRTGTHLDERLPRPSLFDHCIVRAECDGKAYWIDPTMTGNGGTAANRYTPDYGFALLVGPGHQGFERMVVNDTGAVYIREQLEVGPVGTSAELKAEVRYTGRRADAMRSTFAGNSMAEMEKEFADYYTKIYGHCVVKEPLRYVDDRELNALTTYEHYHIAQAWDTLDSGVLSLVATASGVRDHLAVPDGPVRNAPFALGEPLRIHHRIEVMMPQEWDITPEEEHIEGHGVRFAFTSQKLGRMVLLEYEYDINADNVPVAEAADFHAQQERIQNSLVYSFTWTPGTVARKASGDGPSFRTLGDLFLLLFLIGAVVVAVVLYRYDPPRPADVPQWQYEGIGSFLILPAIGLCLSPFVKLAGMLADHGAFFTMTDTFSRMNGDHRTGMVIYGLLSQAIDLTLFGLCIVLVILYFQRRTSVPLLMRVFYGSSVLWLMLDATLYHLLDVEARTGQAYPMADLMRTIVAALVWIPVFRFSGRVKRTFVNRLQQEPPLPLEPVPVPVSVPAADVAAPIDPGASSWKPATDDPSRGPQ